MVYIKNNSLVNNNIILNKSYFDDIYKVCANLPDKYDKIIDEN